MSDGVLLLRRALQASYCLLSVIYRFGYTLLPRRR